MPPLVQVSVSGSASLMFVMPCRGIAAWFSWHHIPKRATVDVLHPFFSGRGVFLAFYVKKIVPGSVPVWDERCCNKYLRAGRLGQSVDVGVMNGQSVPELMNHLPVLRGRYSRRWNISWTSVGGNQNCDRSPQSPSNGFSLLQSAGLMPGRYPTTCRIQLKRVNVQPK